MAQTNRSALIFGARNLGRAIIETLVAQGWNVAGAARSDETLATVGAAGALALRSDITDQAAVRATVEEAAQALGGMDLVVNAAATAQAHSAAARSPKLPPTRSTAGRSRPRARRSPSCRARPARWRRSTGTRP
jgi:NAD(P)-dependent dehydrogenase (short-subunit alcohol dehydrogenase family)